MIKITLPDGSVREYKKGITSLEIAKSISEGFARKALAASVNGQVWDTARAIENDATVKLLTWDDTEGKSTFWHSTAHLMAERPRSSRPGTTGCSRAPAEPSMGSPGTRGLSPSDCRSTSPCRLQVPRHQTSQSVRTSLLYKRLSRFFRASAR